MANTAKNAILRAKLAGVMTDLMPKTITDNVYVNDTTTLTAHLATLAAKADLQTLQQTVDALGALAGKDKVSQADLDDALAAVIAAKAEQTALDEVSGKVTTLVGEDAGKSVRTIANEELAAQLIGENAKESLDTLEEIAAWIQSHPDDASAMNAAITALQNKVDTGDKTVSAYVTDAINALSIGDYAKAADLTALAGRVEALETTANGLGDLAVKDIVSEADLDEALAEKVNAAAEGNHSHANKDVLDGITADVVSAWNGKANVYYSATEPATLNEGDLWVQIVE